MVGLTRLDRFGAWWIIAAHAALPLLAWLSTRAGSNPSARLFRAAYPAILLTGLYSAIDVLNGFGAAKIHDGSIQHAEAWLFGGIQPSRDWWRSYPSTFWSTLLHAVYLSYYLIVPLPLIVFLIQRRPAVVERYLNGLIATYVVCYACYLLWPVAGPYYEFARPAGSFVANPAARAVYNTLAAGSSFGAAFPSSHVAATFAATIGAWTGSRKLGAILLTPTLLLTVGVVYCQMHYVIDSICGMLLGITIPLLINRSSR